MARVERGHAGGCWLWTGAVLNSGYGQFRAGAQGSRVVKAHRWSYEHHVGPVPDGHQVHHRCKVRLCVNPEHLEAVAVEGHVDRHHPDRPVRVAVPASVLAPYVAQARSSGRSVADLVADRLRLV